MRSLSIFAETVWRGHSIRQAQGRLCPRKVYSKRVLAGNFGRVLAAFAVVAFLTPYSAAQRATSAGRIAAPAHSAAPHVHSPAGSFALTRNRRSSAFRRSSPYGSPYTSLPFPFFGDSFNPDDIYSSGYPVASQPPPFLMQALRDIAGPAAGSMGSSPLNDREPSSSQPLMIELQNGRYVHVNSAALDGEALPLVLAPQTKSTKTNSTPTLAIAAASPAPALPPAVLIFRDGHSEEVRDYTIADGVLYARGDYYTDGYWNKKIDLATLNVPQTLQANANRNVKFVLPSSPNEVITRP